MIEVRLLQNATWSALLLTEMPDLARAKARVAWWRENFAA
jgi:hypothetical protein